MHQVSKPRACRLVGQHRSTQRPSPVVNEAEVRLLVDMRRLAGEQSRFGYRRIHRLLIREDWSVNRKQVQRL